MKSYPSISRSTGQAFHEFDAYVFDKLDGSNLRFEWARKGGWYKSGTRTVTFDASHPMWGKSLPIFKTQWADALEETAKKQRWERMVVFMEFWGPHSLAGRHDPTDEMKLTLFDVAPYKKGLLGPKEFLDLFGHLDIAAFLGIHRWTRGFVERVWRGEVEGVTFEGVVGKALPTRHDLMLYKAKTKNWVDTVLGRHGLEEGTKLVES